MERVDYSSWPKVSLSVANLKLDKLNPRIPSYVTTHTTRDILGYLFENEKIERLAGKIVEKGFISHDPIYAVKEGSNYIIVEGNRRVSALKCLLDPSLVPSAAKKRKIENLKNKMGADKIEKIEVFVAPSRRAVDNVLFELHAEGKSQWNRQQKNKFIASIGIEDGESIDEIAGRFNVKVSDIQDSVQEYMLERYFTELDLPNDIEDIALKNKFNISIISRLVNTKKFGELTGFSIRGNKLTTTCSKYLFNAILRGFVIDIVNKSINSRNLNTARDIEAYLDKAIKNIPDSDESDVVDFSLSKDETKLGLELTEPKVRGKRHKETLIPNDISYFTGSDKLDLLIQEAQGMLIDTYKNAAALLLRSIVEMAIIRIFEIHDKKDQCMNGNGRVKNLSDNINALVKRDIWFEDRAYLADLTRFISKDSASWNSLDSLNRYAHGEYTLPDREMLLQVRLTLKPLLTICHKHQLSIRKLKH
ncbi:DUF4145 domain-containing protein [Buttiauxella sp. A2-C2_NF]|uniref:DUF4145 domain-containing protein n=1 Tax=Buttiauxella ferragutiae TaxID=82989 RepID=UPI001E52DBC9|nr:DUF4145 domain-containing protein [Buttiauxella ferragutiae]MCE0828212.1 DUF4145 domain-containing protein [Buttiauxella ferragutiae]